MTFCVGEVLGDYQIIGAIGGSENQLFQVEHRITKRREAMRVVLAELTFDGNIDRLTREVEVLARLNHPGIAGVHNVFSLIDRFLVISELVVGQSLATLISQGLSLHSGVDYVGQALKALAYAHAEGVVHGNITPANIVVTGQGVVKLVNFGFVQSLHDLRGVSVVAESGVLPYAPRRHANGYHVCDPRADVYSVGSVLCEIAIGRLSETERVETILAQFQQEKLPATDQKLRQGLHDVILKARCQDLLLRYQSANELLGALNDVKTQADARCREGRGFGLIRNGSIGALAILSAAAGVFKFNTYQQPARPAAVVFAIPAPNLTQVPRPSFVVAVPKKRQSAALPRSISRAATEAEAAQQQETTNAVVETTPPQPQKKSRGMWSKLSNINPFHKRKNLARPIADEPTRSQ